MKSFDREPGGFAVIATLLMVVIVAVALMAFLAAVASDRASSHAVYNATRARLAMEGAVTLGITRLRDHLEAYPDSATSWETVSDTGGNKLVEGTQFYYRENGEVSVRPLISGGKRRLASGTDASLEVVLPGQPYAHPYNTVDLNAARYPGDQIGWIGSPPGGRRAIRVPWEEMTDPANPQKVIGRFAFWIEDESFRPNINAAERAVADVPEAPLRPEGLTLEALLASSTVSLSGSAINAIKALRAASPGGRLIDLSSLNQLEGLPTLGEDLRFSTTLHSGALNLSRSGAKRLNLNTVINDSNSPTEIRRQLDRIIAAIETQAPDFGQRFYRTASDLNHKDVSSTHAKIYLQKIAANLRDHIDTDSQPTIVNADGSIRLGKPVAGIEPLAGTYWPGVDDSDFKGGENSVIAVGKEAVPYFQEFACRVRLTKFTKVGTRTDYDFFLDYYFEFWNLTSKPIQLGQNAFLRVYDQPGFDTDGGTTIARGRSFAVDLPATLVFPPGKVTVVTTDSTPSTALIPEMSNVVVLPVDDAFRRYQGHTRLTLVSSTNSFRINLQPRTSKTTDYETKMVIGNDRGMIESFCALPLVRGKSSGNNAISIHNGDNAIGDPNGYFFRGGSLVGTIPGSQVGDPRSNHEQLFFRIYDGTGKGGESDKEQTRYYKSGLDNGISNVEMQSTLGKQNTDYSSPNDRWFDSFSWSGIDAPMEIADGPIRSIGELGHLYDPARSVGPSGNIAYSRGGGRTLSIGQPDPLWDKAETSASREWAAWRLADLFCTGDETALEGAINLNGVRRDGGAALKAALRGFTFSASDQSDPALASLSLNSDALVAQIIAWLNARKTPLMERGQLSEALAFGEEWVADGGKPHYDRGREEVFRRLAELSATRGNVFSVYAIGQAVTMTRTGERKIVASSRIKVTFRIDPVWSPPLDDDFDPAKPDEVAARFRKPDRYRVARLQASQQ